MTLPEILKELWEQMQAVAAALTPAAIGSAVAQAWRPGLPWRQRLVQWIVGICVSYYVTLGATEIFNLTPFVAQAIGFVIAMIAFEVTPLFTRAAGDLVAELPTLIKNRIRGAEMIPARQIFAAQANLAKAGFEPGTVDGLLGPRTLAAWCSYIVARPLGALGLLLGTAMAGDFRRFDIVTPLRMAHFLAQAAHETMGFRHFVELGSGDGPDPDPYDDYLQRYDYRRDLGNGAPGDGERWRGRGIFQLTGKANYAAFGQRVGIDLMAQPQRAAEPELSVLIACLYWSDRRLNPLADADDLIAITCRINGGTNGLTYRQAYLARAKRIWELDHDRVA